VWQQQRSGVASVGDFDGSRDVGEIFRARPTNVFLVKATYWMSP
jgi:preprotein translocase subunit SecG